MDRIETYLFILVSCHGNECSFFKSVCIETVPSHGEDIIGLNYVDTGLIFVH